MALKESNAQSADHQPRCEFAKTHFTVGECQRLGEIQFDGSLLCVPHAERLRLEARESTMLGTVFEMDKWLDNPNNRADELRWRRLLRERDETVEELRVNSTLIEAHKEADQQR
jgi:hypothetical protein